MRVPIIEVKPAIFGHAEFTAFHDFAAKLFAQWKIGSTLRLKSFAEDGHPKQLIESISEDLLATFKAAPLLDAYDIYQHLIELQGPELAISVFGRRNSKYPKRLMHLGLLVAFPWRSWTS